MSKNDKITGAEKGFSINKAMKFVKKNVRYFAAGALFAALVLILANCTEPQKDNGVDNTEAVTESTSTEGKYEVDAVPEVSELIRNYYTAYANGSIKELKKIATPITKNERSYIKMFSEYVEEYRNIVCYTKPGLDENSYLVSAYIEIKFKDVESVAPGLDFFYVSKDGNGELYINNLYSQFNLLNGEKELDKDIKALIDEFELETDVIELQKEVQVKYEKAVGTDEKLAKMLNGTIKDACTVWAQQIVENQPVTEQTTEVTTEQTPGTEQTPETEQTTETEKEPETETETVPEVQPEVVYTTDTVNIRAKADANSEVIDKVEAGTALTRVGTTDNGWSKLEYNNTECYVKSEYVTTQAPETPDTPEEPDESEGNGGAIAEGTTVRLSQSVNVRASMDTSAEKLGTAFSGETVTVIMSYAEGWTKVEWNGQTGYIKTEFLN